MCLNLLGRVEKQTIASRRHSVKLARIQRATLNLAKFPKQLFRLLRSKSSILISIDLCCSCSIRQKRQSYLQYELLHMDDTTLRHRTDEYWAAFMLRLVACAVAIFCIIAGSKYPLSL